MELHKNKNHLLLSDETYQVKYKNISNRFVKYISNFDSSTIDLNLLVKHTDNITPYQKTLLELIGVNNIFTTKGPDNSNIHPDKPYFIFKNRGYGSKTGYIIACIGSDYYARHWDLYYNKPKDVRWELKQNTVFWRGAFTGQPQRPGSRYKLLLNNFGKNNLIDLGLTASAMISDKQRKYIKNRWITKKVKVEDFLKYKYILSVHGNDKDSGLNWKLNSNSLVLMNKPEYTSWLLECDLIPWIHYVPLNFDFTDLFDKLMWCEANQSKCKEIVKNANEFMKQFSNIEVEKKIERMVISHYKRNLKRRNLIN